MKVDTGPQTHESQGITFRKMAVIPFAFVDEQGDTQKGERTLWRCGVCAATTTHAGLHADWHAPQ